MLLKDVRPRFRGSAAAAAADATAGGDEDGAGEETGGRGAEGIATPLHAGPCSWKR